MVPPSNTHHTGFSGNNLMSKNRILPRFDKSYTSHMLTERPFIRLIDKKHNIEEISHFLIKTHRVLEVYRAHQLTKHHTLWVPLGVYVLGAFAVLLILYNCIFATLADCMVSFIIVGITHHTSSCCFPSAHFVLLSTPLNSLCGLHLQLKTLASSSELLSTLVATPRAIRPLQYIYL